MIDAWPRTIYQTGTSIVTFRGTPHTKITWTLIGTGVLTQVEDFTNASGVAKALFTPSIDDQTAIIKVSYGA